LTIWFLQSLIPYFTKRSVLISLEQEIIWASLLWLNPCASNRMTLIAHRHWLPTFLDEKNLLLMPCEQNHSSKYFWGLRPILSNYGLFQVITGLNCFVKKVLRFTGKSTEIYFSCALKSCLWILITLAPAIDGHKHSKTSSIQWS
jgi:hypothetical protein